MAKYDVVGGQVVKLVAEDVNAESHAAELQADLDARQDLVNVAVQERSRVETELAELEKLAEEKANELEVSKAAVESAEEELAKSLDSRNSFLAAVELANSQPVADESDSDGEDSEDDDEEAGSGSESVDVPVNVVTAG